MKIRMGFVSNSSSSAFIIPYLALLDMSHMRNLSMAFDEVMATEKGILVKYTGGRELAEKIIMNLLPWMKQPYWQHRVGIKWTCVE